MNCNSLVWLPRGRTLLCTACLEISDS